ncbi:MAG: protein-disulfide reductase DsbD domain-containing protein [Pseudomonadota bacterium]
MRIAFQYVFLIAFAGLAPALSHASDWVEAYQSKVRFESAGFVETDRHKGFFTAVTLAYDKGWKTYWRNPGDAGISPRFDWTGSVNLKSATVLYPAPGKFFDGYADSIGYGGTGITFPIALEADNPDRPIVLSLAIDYAVCERICIPERAELSAFVRPEPISGGSNVVAALNAVPKNHGGPAMVAQIEPGDPAKSVMVKIDASGDVELFAEGPNREPMLVPKAHEGAEKPTFSVPLDGLPAEKRVAGTEFRFTIVSADGAYEQVIAAE